MPVTQGMIEDFSSYPPKDWVSVRGPVVGAHCVPLIAYDAAFVECIMWGRLQRMTWDFLNSQINEVYAAVGPEMFKADGMSFSGYNQADMLQLSQNLASVLDSIYRKIKNQYPTEMNRLHRSNQSELGIALTPWGRESPFLSSTP
jgi:hypothetical protein